MRKLSDYKGNDAIDLWADLLIPITSIMSDDKIANVVRSGMPKMTIAQTILKNHKEDAIEILTRISGEPVDGLNVIVQLISVLTEIGQNEAIKPFFGFAEQVSKDKKSSGSVTESTEAEEK